MSSKRCFLAKRILIILLLFSSLFSLPAVPPVSEGEVRIALQSTVVAGIVALAAQKINLQDATLVIESDAAFTAANLTFKGADIGRLRRIIVETPPPEERQMGFIEMLLGSVIPLLPSYERLVSFLVPQGLYEGEVIFSGTVSGVRKAAPYPFRYQGEVSLEVSGSRFNAPFTLEGEFMVPLEGEERGKIVPLAIWADSIDFLPTGNSLFR